VCHPFDQVQNPLALADPLKGWQSTETFEGVCVDFDIDEQGAATNVAVEKGELPFAISASKMLRGTTFEPFVIGTEKRRLVSMKMDVKN
jgi:hypothetical protein